jgi:hypothetical protein
MNRRVPNGTLGGVRGRLPKEWAASYSIINFNDNQRLPFFRS